MNYMTHSDITLKTAGSLLYETATHPIRSAAILITLCAAGTALASSAPVIAAAHGLSMLAAASPIGSAMVQGSILSLAASGWTGILNTSFFPEDGPNVKGYAALGALLAVVGVGVLAASGLGILAAPSIAIGAAYGAVISGTAMSVGSAAVATAESLLVRLFDQNTKTHDEPFLNI